MPIQVNDKVYQLFHHSKETEFEKLVGELSDSLFGSSAIYIEMKKRLKGSDIITIPDAYLIDMAVPMEPKLYVIENEIVSHDPFTHIGIQMLKFATCFDEAKYDLRNQLMREISSDKERLKRLQSGCAKSEFRNIDNYLDAAVFGDFRALVVIDEARDELHNVLQKINANISVLELKVFRCEEGDDTY